VIRSVDGYDKGERRQLADGGMVIDRRQVAGAARIRMTSAEAQSGR
jgi:hypothetical protein